CIPTEWRDGRGHPALRRKLGSTAVPAYAAVAAICASVFCSDASSPTVTQVFERSICRISPHRTFPGPTSINKLAPLLISNRTDRSHLTAPVTWRIRASREASAEVTIAASTLQTTGHDGF